MARLSLINSHLVIDINKVIFLHPPPFSHMRATRTAGIRNVSLTVHRVLNEVNASIYQRKLVAKFNYSNEYSNKILFYVLELFLSCFAFTSTSLGTDEMKASVYFKDIRINRIPPTTNERERASEVVFTARRSLCRITEFN